MREAMQTIQLYYIRRSPPLFNFQEAADALLAHMTIVVTCPQTKRN